MVEIARGIAGLSSSSPKVAGVVVPFRTSTLGARPSLANKRGGTSSAGSSGNFLRLALLISDTSQSCGSGQMSPSPV